MYEIEGKMMTVDQIQAEAMLMRAKYMRQLFRKLFHVKESGLVAVKA